MSHHVPIVSLPESLRLNEIVIDSTLRHLVICTGEDDEIHGMYEDIDDCEKALPLAILRQAHIFYDRIDSDSELITIPTITVGPYRGRELEAGELHLDDIQNILYVGYPNPIFVETLCLRVSKFGDF